MHVNKIAHWVLIIEVLHRETRQLKVIKEIKIESGAMYWTLSVSLLVDEVMICKSDLKHSTRDVIELIANFNKIAG